MLLMALLYFCLFSSPLGTIRARDPSFNVFADLTVLVFAKSLTFGVLRQTFDALLRSQYAKKAEPNRTGVTDGIAGRSRLKLRRLHRKRLGSNLTKRTGFFKTTGTPAVRVPLLSLRRTLRNRLDEAGKDADGRRPLLKTSFERRF